MQTYKILPILFIMVVGTMIFATQVPMMFAILPEGGGGGSSALDPFVSGTNWYFYRNHYDGDLEPEVNEVTATGDNGDGIVSIAAYVYSYAKETDSDDVLNVRFNTYYKSRLDPTYPLVPGVMNYLGIEVQEVSYTSYSQIEWKHNAAGDQWGWPQPLINSVNKEYAYRVVGTIVVKSAISAGITAGLSVFGLPGIATTVISMVSSHTIAAGLYTAPIYGDSGFTSGTTTAKYAFENGYPYNTYRDVDGNLQYVNEGCTTHYARIHMRRGISFGTILRARAYCHYFAPNSYMDIKTIYSNYIYFKMVG